MVGGDEERKTVESNPAQIPEIQIIQEFKTRWLVLSLFVLYAASNSFQWIELAVISDVVEKYYNKSAIWVNWTATVSMVTYLIFIIPSSYLLDKMGIRKVVILGMTFTTVGSWIKLASVDRHRFWVAFLGQTIASLASPLILSVPSRLAAVWFGESQVATACSIGIFGTQLGIAGGFLVPPLIINNASEENINGQFYTLHTSLAVATTIILIIILLFFKDAPPLPPSVARAKQESAKSDSFLESLKNLSRNRSFMLVIVAFGICVGIVMSLSTLINPILVLYYPNGGSEVGIVGFILVFAGFIGSVCFGLILDKYHKYKQTTLIVYACGVFAMMAFTFTIWRGIYIVYIVTFFIGLFMAGLVPVGFELAAELTYPEPEGTTGGLLVASVQLFSLLYNIIYPVLFYRVNCAWANLFFLINLIFGWITLLFTESDTRRQAAQCEV